MAGKKFTCKELSAISTLIWYMRTTDQNYWNNLKDLRIENREWKSVLSRRRNRFRNETSWSSLSSRQKNNLWIWSSKSWHSIAAHLKIFDLHPLACCLLSGASRYDNNRCPAYLAEHKIDYFTEAQWKDYPYRTVELVVLSVKPITSVYSLWSSNLWWKVTSQPLP